MATAGSARAGALACAVLATTLGVVSPVRADVYTWVDPAGNVNLSNLEPPQGARILRVTHDSAPAKARDDAAYDAAQQARIVALSQRIADLEKRAEAAAGAAPPPVVYAAAPAIARAPPQVNVVVVPATTALDATPDYGCAWVGCALPWASFAYPAAVFFTAKPDSRHGRASWTPRMSTLRPLTTPITIRPGGHGRRG